MQILFNAIVHTLEPHHPVVSALAIDRGVILAAGSTPELIALYGQGGVSVEIQDALPGENRNLLIDLNGRTILPGLTDAHIHLEYYSLGLQKVDCETDTRDECLRRVAERARTLPPGQWVLGHGWNQNNWPQGFGSAADLDAVAPNNPVYLTTKSLHAAWVNRAALQLAGITASTADPSNGQIGRNLKGEPDGILFEGAMNLVGDVIPAPGVEDVAQALRVVQPILWKMGLTGVHDFDRRRCFQALQLLHERELLGLRDGQTVVIRGQGSIDGLGALVVRTTGIYVRP